MKVKSSTKKEETTAILATVDRFCVDPSKDSCKNNLNIY